MTASEANLPDFVIQMSIEQVDDEIFMSKVRKLYGSADFQSILDICVPTNSTEPLKFLFFPGLNLAIAII